VSYLSLSDLLCFLCVCVCVLLFVYNEGENFGVEKVKKNFKKNFKKDKQSEKSRRRRRRSPEKMTKKKGSIGKKGEKDNNNKNKKEGVKSSFFVFCVEEEDFVEEVIFLKWIYFLSFHTFDILYKKEKETRTEWVSLYSLRV